MERKIEETESLVTMQDHFELISEIVGCASELLDGANETTANNLEKEFSSMITAVTKSLKQKCKFIVKQSARFHKKPSIWQRLHDWREERAERKEEKRLRDEQYREFLRQYEAEEDEEEADAKQEQSVAENSSLPVVRKECPVDILDEETAEGEEETHAEEE